MQQFDKIILLVGLMGSGKTSVGKRLAKNLIFRLSTETRKLKKPRGFLW